MDTPKSLVWEVVLQVHAQASRTSGEMYTTDFSALDHELGRPIENVAAVVSVRLATDQRGEDYRSQHNREVSAQHGTSSHALLLRSQTVSLFVWQGQHSASVEARQRCYHSCRLSPAVLHKCKATAVRRARALSGSSLVVVLAVVPVAARKIKTEHEHEKPIGDELYLARHDTFQRRSSRPPREHGSMAYGAFLSRPPDSTLPSRGQRTSQLDPDAAAIPRAGSSTARNRWLPGRAATRRSCRSARDRG